MRARRRETPGSSSSVVFPSLAMRFLGGGFATVPPRDLVLSASCSLRLARHGHKRYWRNRPMNDLTHGKFLN